MRACRPCGSAATSCLIHAVAMSGAAVGLIEGDELNKVLVAERRAEPVAVLAFAAGDDRLVHQVVAEDGRASCTRPATASQKRACAAQRSFSASLSYQAGTSSLW